jgi:hypothetical protein
VFRQFHHWVTGNTSRATLARWHDSSRRTFVRRFAPFFVRPLTPQDVWIALPPNCASSTHPWIYGADGKWLRRDGVFLVHRDVTYRENLWWSYAFNESFSSWHRDLGDLAGMLTRDQFPVAAVSDWKRGLIQAVAHAFGELPHQRCLAHVARHAATLLPKGSPYRATRRLRDVARALRRIRTKADMDAWKQALTAWGYQHGEMLIEKTVAPRGSTRTWWYTHGNLRRGWRLLTTDVEAFFLFLAVTGLPKTNNSLEGVNRNLKGKLGIHRGLTTALQVSLLSWVMVFSRVKHPVDLRRLWGIWQRRQ